MRIGAILGDVGEEREEAIASYGLNLGICFQMIDDLLDFTADEKILGKPVANDLREGKLTLPAIFVMRRAGKRGAEMISAVVKDRGFDRVSSEDVARLARECGALDEARSLAEEYAAAARADLLAFERSPYREALAALPDFILSRDQGERSKARRSARAAAYSSASDRASSRAPPLRKPRATSSDETRSKPRSFTTAEIISAPRFPARRIANGRQRELSLAQVVDDRLSEDPLVRGEIEHVVDHLVRLTPRFRP